jgi:hypothetical protein
LKRKWNASAFNRLSSAAFCWTDSGGGRSFDHNEERFRLRTGRPDYLDLASDVERPGEKTSG